MDLLKIITFVINDSYFALPSKSVKEVVDYDEDVKGLFYGSGAIDGILSYEGDLVSVLNSSFFFDIPGEREEPLILICRESKESTATGITISSIKGIGFVDTSQIKSAQSSEADYIYGFIRENSEAGQRVTALLDLGKFLEYASKKIENLMKVKS
ncbi:MAG: chemotaxis protein CheW [bacterium]|nr:chemotaxis protein CheW [bacterium]